jgi:hypothetical protein
MRLVVDTNVFISTVLKAGSPPFVVVRWIDAAFGPSRRPLHGLLRMTFFPNAIISFWSS